MRRVVQIPAWLAVIVIMMAFVSPPLTFVASVRIADNNAKRLQEEARKAEIRQQEQSRILACFLFGSILDAYQEIPATTKAGKNQEKAWHELYKLSKCQPLR